MSYGILVVQYDNGFRRRWLTAPGGKPRLFDSLQAADEFANDMVLCARENGIKNVGYRGRAYDAKTQN